MSYLHYCVDEEGDNPDGVERHDEAHVPLWLLVNRATSHRWPHTRDRTRLQTHKVNSEKHRVMLIVCRQNIL